ncbi:hypothetical protein [Candidatus Nitrotoga sp. M5]|uniref:hypothetical protein n=1 Tax=Candidatus Nitrotoga sp. M5 TaxID=2890409 RepID=UPI001EF31880|nr:hypothetical protein [Candidatus Nitrotoga sp. M5]CAH1386432.1 hypothetical protein NTGM5_290031 [Candidatus Nitrotoga sp. M5]
MSPAKRLLIKLSEGTEVSPQNIWLLTIEFRLKQMVFVNKVFGALSGTIMI